MSRVSYFSTMTPELIGNHWKCWRLKYRKDQEADATLNVDYCLVSRQIKYRDVVGEFLGNGSFNAVYRATLARDLTIGDVTYLTGTVLILKSAFPRGLARDWQDDPQRLARIWNEIYPELPKATVADGILFMPYIESLKNEKGEAILPTDEEITDELIRIYNNTGRMVVDAFVRRNWIKTPEGRIICIDPGAVIRLHQHRHRSPSPESLKFWSSNAGKYGARFREDKIVDLKTTEIFKAMHYLQKNFPEITRVDFLKNAGVARIFAEFPLKNDAIKSLIELSDEYVEHYFKRVEFTEEAGELIEKYALTDRQIALLHFQKSLTAKHLDMFNFLRSRRLDVTAALSIISGLNSAQLDVFFAMYDKPGFNRKYLDLGFGIEFTQTHGNFLRQHVSSERSVSEVRRIIWDIDEAHLKYFDEVYQALPLRIKKGFLHCLSLVQQTNGGVEFIDDLSKIWNRQGRVTVPQLMVFGAFYAASPIGFRSSHDARNSILKAFANATEELMNGVLALVEESSKIEILYRLIRYYEMSAVVALKVLPCLSIDDFRLAGKDHLLEILGGSVDPDVIDYVRRQTIPSEPVNNHRIFQSREVQVKRVDRQQNSSCCSCVVQ